MSSQSISEKPNNIYWEIPRKIWEGGTLGAGVVMGVTPLLYVKNMMMLGQSIVPKHCVRGIFLNGASVVPTTAVAITTNSLAARFFQPEGKALTTWQKLVCSAAAGAVSGFVSTVPENIVQNRQAETASLSTRDVIVGAKNVGGYRSLMRGASVVSGREGLYAAGYMTVSKMVSQWIRQRYDNEAVADGASAIFTGGLVGAATTPLDAARALKQEALLKTAKPMSYGEIFRTMGFRGAFKGMAPRSLAVVIATYLMVKGQKLYSSK